MGGAVAAGILYGLADDEIVGSALLAASLPLATSDRTNISGLTVRNLYAGLSAHHALSALQFHEAGFRSSPEVVYHIWGEQLSSQLNEALLTQNLWEPPLIENNYFKLIPSCRFAHAPIEALKHLIDKHEFSSNQVSSIQVDIHRLGANMNVAAPPNMLAAMFSIPFLLSLVLHKKSLYLKENDPLLQDRQLQIAASQVQVIEDPTLTALLPNIRAAKVTVKLHGGEILTEEVQSPRGSYEQHLELDQQFAKFYPYLDEDSHESFKHMLDTTMKLETMHTDEWIATLQHK